MSSTLADLKGALQDLSGELREERQGSQELTQQFARAKASWEVERTELKSLITQVRPEHLLKVTGIQIELLKWKLDCRCTQCG